MRKLNSKLVMNFISDKGNDPIEKTYVAYTPLENYMCIAVAESYDNDMEQNSAQLAVEAVLTAFEKKPSLKRIREYVRYANEQVLLHSTRNQLKVSITLLVTDYTRMRYAVCGNTRLHVLYENLFTHVSNTQTKYQQLLEADTDERPEASEIHNLTRYLGKGRHVKPYISKKINLTEGSSILLSTSNLWGRISEVEILDAYENAKTNEELLDSLQELLLSLQDQDSQKIGSFTAAVLSIEKTFKEDVAKKRKRKKLFIIISAVVLTLLLIFLIVILSIRAMDRGKIREIEKLDKKGVQYITYENYARSLEEYEKASELADKLSLNNWQYIEKKKELKDSVSERTALLTMVQEGETALTGKDYELARTFFSKIQKQASYQGLTSLAAYAGKRLKEINLNMQIAQLVTLGDMYASTEDYGEALGQYNEALKLLSETSDVETRGDVQAKIYDIRQKQKEAKQTQQEAAAEEKQNQADKNIIRLNALIASANKALGEGRIERAKELYNQALSQYSQFSGSGEDADKAFEDITALGQAITEAEVKAAEEAREEQLNKAAKYTVQAKEAVKKEDTKEALKLYEKALKIYEALDIWDERVEEINEAVEAIEQAAAQGEEATPEPGASPTSGAVDMILGEAD